MKKKKKERLTTLELEVSINESFDCALQCLHTLCWAIDLNIKHERK